MILENIVSAAKYFASEILDDGDVVIDATCGNGNDTLFLAEQIGESGVGYAFDIQKQAIDNTKQLLKQHNIKNIKLCHDSHSKFTEHIQINHQGKIAVIMYNLGYLPNGDKNIVTNASSTISSIKTGLTLLKPQGRIVLAIYRGHSEGAIESDEVLKFLSTLNPKEVTVLKYEFINRKQGAPFLVVLHKKK